jgi:hypothetical protein
VVVDRFERAQSADDVPAFPTDNQIEILRQSLVAVDVHRHATDDEISNIYVSSRAEDGFDAMDFHGL